MGTFQPRDDRHGQRSRTVGGPIRPILNHDDDHKGFLREKPDYKTQALCKQVRRALTMALSGECCDTVLQALVVDDVLPAPNAGRLLVRLISRRMGDGPGVVEILGRLERVQGLLRASIAEAIARKRTPELTFSVVMLDGPAAESSEVSDG